MQPWFVTLCGACARVVGVFARLLFLILLLRYLGVETYALFAILLSLEGWLALTDWGLGSSSQNAVSHIRVTGEDETTLFRSIGQLGILFFLLSFVLASFLAPLVYPFLLGHLSPSLSNVPSLFLTLFAYSALAIGSIGYRVLYARQKGYWVHVWQTVGILFSVGAVWLLVQKPDVQNKLFFSVCAVLVPQSLVAFFVFLTVFWRYFDFLKWDFPQLKTLLRDGSHFFSFGLGAILVLGIDYIVMGRYLSAESIVVYHIANRMFMGFFVLHGTWMQAVWPVYSELVGKKEFGKMRSLVKENCLYGTLFILIVTGGIASFSPFFCKLFFSSQHLVIPFSLICALGFYYLVRALTDPFATALQSMNKMKPLLVGVGFQALFAWIGETLFAQIWGVYGVILGLIFSYLMTVSWILPRFFYRQMQMKVS